MRRTHFSTMCGSTGAENHTAQMQGEALGQTPQNVIYRYTYTMRANLRGRATLRRPPFPDKLCDGTAAIATPDWLGGLGSSGVWG